MYYGQNIIFTLKSTFYCLKDFINFGKIKVVRIKSDLFVQRSKHLMSTYFFHHLKPSRSQQQQSLESLPMIFRSNRKVFSSLFLFSKRRFQLLNFLIDQLSRYIR